MATPDLSLCMIIRNEERHLERCLASVQGWVSEIIIGDTGSSDGSIGIASSFGAQVIEIPWENDFAKARNLTLRAASCSWILVLDADEAIAGWREEVLQPLLEAEKVQGYFLPFIHYVGNTSGREYVTDNVCRLFRNDARIVFEGVFMRRPPEASGHCRKDMSIMRSCPLIIMATWMMNCSARINPAAI